MPITRLEDVANGVARFDINNGDLNALNDIVDRWGFKDHESALKFAIGVLLASDSNTLSLEKPDGKVILKPQSSLLK